MSIMVTVFGFLLHLITCNFDLNLSIVEIDVKSQKTKG